MRFEEWIRLITGIALALPEFSSTRLYQSNTLNFTMSAIEKTYFEQFASIVGDSNVIQDTESLAKYAQDFSPFPAISPKLVVRPSTVKQVSQILEFANQNHLKIITRGGGVSLTGFEQVTERTILLETKRMSRVLDLNESNMTVTAECGIVLNALEEAVSRKGFYINTVSVPVKFSTLGGILSGVVGGGLPIRGPEAGTDQHYLLGMKVVLPTGKILETSAGGSNVHMKHDFIRGGNGPDLTGMFVGDAGCFGVKVEATMQIFPNRPLVQTGAWVFETFDQVWAAMRRLLLLEPLPYTQLKVRDTDEIVLTYVTESQSKAINELNTTAIETICRENSGKEGSESLQEVARQYTSFMRQDNRVTEPQGMVAYMIGNSEFPTTYTHSKKIVHEAMREKYLEKEGVQFFSTFRPNTHNGIYVNFALKYDPTRPKGKAEVLELTKELYRYAISNGGCPEPHQGFGALLMARAWSPEYLSLMKDLKMLLDPNDVLNPNTWGIYSK